MCFASTQVLERLMGRALRGARDYALGAELGGSALAAVVSRAPSQGEDGRYRSLLNPSFLQLVH